MSYVVYIHENLINGKVYIGITGQKPSRRWDNGRGYIRNPHFSKAIKKYGWHNFNHRILYDGLTLKEANEIERKLIKEYDSTNPLKGYNIQLGGNGSGKFSNETLEKLRRSHKGEIPWNRGIPHSQETRKKISEAVKGFKHSDVTRKRMSESKRGDKNSFYGKHHTKECIRKMVLNQPRRRLVRCVDTGIIYESMADASRKTGVTQGNISNVCNGKQKTARGLKWEFFENEY